MGVKAKEKAKVKAKVKIAVKTVVKAKKTANPRGDPGMLHRRKKHLAKAKEKVGKAKIMASIPTRLHFSNLQLHRGAEGEDGADLVDVAVVAVANSRWLQSYTS